MRAPEIVLKSLLTPISTKENLVVGVFADDVKGLSPALKKYFSREELASLHNYVSQRGFKARLNDLIYFPAKKEQLTIFVGLGARKNFKLDNLRQAAAVSLNLLEKIKVKKVIFSWPDKLTKKYLEKDLLVATCEGLWLGAYEFDKYKASAKNKFTLGLVQILVKKVDRKLLKQLEESRLITQAVNTARDMQNENADEVNPQSVAEYATKLARSHRLKLTNLDAEQLQKKGLNLIWSIGRASKWLPKLILLEYRGNPRDPAAQAVVGKGVTFDTGGVNLKPSRGGFLEQMHMDMSGAAVVLQLVKLAQELKLKTNILAVVPIVENAIDGNAVKPGSIIKAYDGTSVEIVNTDAEGRLILADAIAYVVKNKNIKTLIDIATLSGVTMLTFNRWFAGLISNQNKLARALIEAGNKTNEQLWRLPLTNQYRQEIKGERSDLCNICQRERMQGDSIQAAAFLEHFARNIPFAHLDIAGTAIYPHNQTYTPAGGTGFGVRLLLNYFKANPRGPLF